MTIQDVKMYRAMLQDELQAKVAPMIEAFEANTGVAANVQTRHLDVTTHGDSAPRWKVTVEVNLDWEAL